MICQSCGSEMSPLFSSFFCPNDCDREPTADVGERFFVLTWECFDVDGDGILRSNSSVEFFVYSTMEEPIDVVKNNAWMVEGRRFYVIRLSGEEYSEHRFVSSDRDVISGATLDGLRVADHLALEGIA